MKRQLSPRKLAFYAALVVGLFSLLYGVAYLIMPVIPVLWHIILAALLTGLTGYLVFLFVLKKFIYDRIRLIYKIIHTKKMDKGTPKMKVPVQADSIEQVATEVQEWSEQYSREVSILKDHARYRREFLGNISHELKNPIFNIQGYVLTLLDGGLEDPKINREYLLRTEKSIERIIAIVNDLETISKLETGELQLDTRDFDLLDLIEEVIEFMEMKARKREITIACAETYEGPVMVHADKDRIRQVLVNLIDNAIKYSDPGGRAKISLFDMDDHILFEITDEGIGIEESDIPRLFERFYRTGQARSRKQSGSGLGLAIAKHIMEAHRQTIHVRSKPGVGTTFALTLQKGGR
ncbi:MAG TPA: ATP-binding protein [Bacteroidales bacterium]|nr:ATP-binding protein [Bacteroidales bacterium]HRZ47920.1 ATP-binding protein [Bacteroidales bacterium]